MEPEQQRRANGRLSRLSRRLRYPLGLAALVAALTAGVRPAPPARVHPTAIADNAAVPAFRLGTAARPFAWSTAVADFNRDGLADTAVADRQSRIGSGYLYELRFSVSGLAPRSVSFESAQPALTVTVRDVDHDNDLDVVVSEVVSRVVTNVWLNDGRGHFTEAAPPQDTRPNRVEPAPAAATDVPGGALAAATTSEERAPTALLRAGLVEATPARHVAGLRSDAPRPSDRAYARPLRAPPAPPSLAS